MPETAVDKHDELLARENKVRLARQQMPAAILPAVGCVTASANAVAVAASIALPPFAITAQPTSDATLFCDTTIPRDARQSGAGHERRRHSGKDTRDERTN